MEIAQVGLDLAEERIGKASDLGASQGVDRFDSFVKDRVVWDAIEKHELVHCDAEVLEDERVDRVESTGGKTSDPLVNEQKSSQHAIHDFCKEGLVPRIPTWLGECVVDEPCGISIFLKDAV